VQNCCHCCCTHEQDACNKANKMQKRQLEQCKISCNGNYAVFVQDLCAHLSPVSAAIPVTVHNLQRLILYGLLLLHPLLQSTTAAHNNAAVWLRYRQEQLPTAAMHPLASSKHTQEQATSGVSQVLKSTMLTTPLPCWHPAPYRIHRTAATGAATATPCLRLYHSCPLHHPLSMHRAAQAHLGSCCAHVSYSIAALPAASPSPSPP
jgi:hypothetical protein